MIYILYNHYSELNTEKRGAQIIFYRRETKSSEGKVIYKEVKFGRLHNFKSIENILTFEECTI